MNGYVGKRQQTWWLQVLPVQRKPLLAWGSQGVACNCMPDMLQHLNAIKVTVVRLKTSNHFVV
jgi:hypothetical protein